MLYVLSLLGWQIQYEEEIDQNISYLAKFKWLVFMPVLPSTFSFFSPIQLLTQSSLQVCLNGVNICNTFKNDFSSHGRRKTGVLLSVTTSSGLDKSGSKIHVCSLPSHMKALLPEETVRGRNICCLSKQNKFQRYKREVWLKAIAEATTDT